MKYEKIGHIKLFGKEFNPTNSPVLIVGNAYGIMPYILPLADSLAEKNFAPYWFPFSGQEGTEGVYCFKQGVKDLDVVISRIKEKHGVSEIKLLTHCAGSLFTLDYIKNNPKHSISDLVIYGLLYSPNRRRRVAEKRLKLCGVNYALSEEEWNYNPLPALAKVEIPTLFCHAKDKLNLQRATSEEMSLAVEATPNAQIKWFDEGYDKDTSLIKNFISYYDAFLN